MQSLVAAGQRALYIGTQQLRLGDETVERPPRDLDVTDTRLTRPDAAVPAGTVVTTSRDGRQKATRRRVVRSAAGAGGAAALVLAGCEPRQSGGARRQPSAGPVTLRVHIQTGSYADFTRKWGDRYAQERPNVSVVVEPFPTANQEYHTKLKTLHVTGSIGDMAWTWATQGLLPEFGHLKVWRPVDDLVRAERFDPRQYFPAIVDGMTFEGRLLGLPFHGHPGFPFFFYNTDLFQKRGACHRPPGSGRSIP